MKRSKILVLSVFLFIAFLLASQISVFAASQVNELNMIVRPEYDKAQTVFIWGHGKLAGEANQKISFVIPKTVDDNSIHICQLDDSGQTVKCFLREKDEVAGGLKISAEVTPNFKTEYYYPTTTSGSNKSTSWAYETDFDVKKLSIQVAEPTGASDFKVSQKAQSTSKDDQGFKMHNYTFNNVKAGENIKFDISYKRANNEASVGYQGGPQNNTTNTGTSSAGGGTIIAAIIAALAVAGGIVFGLVTMNNRSSKPSSSKRVTPVAPKANARFCIECGSRITGGKFCPNCGAKVK